MPKDKRFPLLRCLQDWLIGYNPNSSYRRPSYISVLQKWARVGAPVDWWDDIVIKVQDDLDIAADEDGPGGSAPV